MDNNRYKDSCINKRNLYLHCRNSNDTKLKGHYKLYCKILSKVIKAAKKLHYDKIILNSKNKTKTTWDIIKTETGKNESKQRIHQLNIGFITHNL
jgi:regulator of sigma D